MCDKNNVHCAIKDSYAYGVRNLGNIESGILFRCIELYRTVELQVEVVPY